jgi:ATP-dependent Clp protease ATP-binding subunit ClpA
MNVDQKALRRTLEDVAKGNPRGVVAGNPGQIFMTPRLKRVIDLSEEEASLMKDDYIGTEHILLAILSDPYTPVGRFLGDVREKKTLAYRVINEIRDQDRQRQTEKTRDDVLQEARAWFEPQLSALGLSTDQINSQNTEELGRSLELVNDIVRSPQSFSTDKGKDIVPLILERKRLILQRLQTLQQSPPTEQS